jgi:predicted ATP-binding protein involved in virulence
LLAFYGTGRLWAQKREKIVDPFKAGSRTLGYLDCLDPYSNEKLFTRWFKKMKYIALEEEGKEPGELLAVKSAIESCLKNVYEDNYGEEEGKVRIDYSIKEDEIKVTLEDGRVLPFRMLSDGYRNTLGMVADIAFRASVLNPQLEGRSSEEPAEWF